MIWCWCSQCECVLHRGSRFKTHNSEIERRLYLCAVRGCRQGKDTTGTCSKVLQEEKHKVYCVFGIFGQSTQVGLLRVQQAGNPVYGLLTTFGHTAISISCFLWSLSQHFFLSSPSLYHTLVLFSQHALCFSAAWCCSNVLVYKHNSRLLQVSIHLSKHVKLRRTQLVQQSIMLNLW